MPTDKQLKWLEGVLQGKIKKQDNVHKFSVYKKRIREDIDAELERLKWIAVNYPEILTDEEWEIQNHGTLKHRRLIKFMEIVKAIMPETDPVLVKLRKDINLV